LLLTIEESTRFDKSRAVGPFLGLTPKRDQSGQTDKQLRITKAGDAYLRRLLVGCAQRILGPFGPDCDLRRFGLKLAARGGKNAKRRAVVAVARETGGDDAPALEIRSGLRPMLPTESQAKEGCIASGGTATASSVL